MCWSKPSPGFANGERTTRTTTKCGKCGFAGRTSNQYSNGSFWRDVADFLHSDESTAVETHPDKTSIGRIDRGFHFLGYDFDATGLVGVAPTTYERFVKRVNRLYEQGASARCIGDYVRRWYRWLVSGLGDWITTLRWTVCSCDANGIPSILPPRYPSR
jgi:hypothetical protein